MNDKKKQLDELKDMVYLSVLYDFYSELLTDNKKKIFEDYYLNDLSLSEIAKEQKISRQGVHDALKRAVEELKTYESKLQLLLKFQKIKDKLEKINSIADEINDKNNKALASNIKELVKDIIKEL